MVKKFMKELLLIIVILIIAVDLRIYTPVLRLYRIVFPDSFCNTQANVVDIEETRLRVVEGVIFIKRTRMEYTVNHKKYSAQFYYRDSDQEGESVNINVFKVYPKLTFRNRIEIPTIAEIIWLITLIQTLVLLLKVHWYEPDKVEKKNRDGIKKAKKEVPELYHFLKKHKADYLLNELMMIRDPHDFNNLNQFGLFINQNINAIITETEKEWEKGHKIGYIIIGDTDEKTILYKIKDEFIYSFNKHTFKYVFEAGGLVKYLKLLGCDLNVLDSP